MKNNLLVGIDIQHDFCDSNTEPLVQRADDINRVANMMNRLSVDSNYRDFDETSRDFNFFNFEGTFYDC